MEENELIEKKRNKAPSHQGEMHVGPICSGGICEGGK
jgi:hypothetical protein